MSDQDVSEFDKMVAGAGVDVDAITDPEEQQSGIQLANFSQAVNMSSDDVQIPRLRLTQGLTAEVQEGTAKPGQWVLTGFEAVDDLLVVPIMFARNRTLRDDEGSILCKSLDAQQGIGEPGGTCDGCVMNMWVDNGKGKGKNTPPKCSFSYVYIVYIKGWETMALIEFRRTSLPAGKTLNTMVAQRGLGNFAIKLKSSKQTGAKGAYFQIVVAPTQSDPELLANARMFMSGGK